jgi:DNA-binding CsgD family transcriptional regulator
MTLTSRQPRGLARSRRVTRDGPGPGTGQLVGRGEALSSIEHALDALAAGESSAIELRGEAGIGKTALFRQLAAAADLRGDLVLTGAASEFERDLPFSVFVDAVDQYVAGLDPATFAVFDHQVRNDLAHVFPSLSRLGVNGVAVRQEERHRVHRSVRALLERLAHPRPLVLLLDDLHWADAASVELLAALLHRPPDAPVLLGLALRPVRSAGRLAAALERGRRSAVLTQIELPALTRQQARELLGDGVGAADLEGLYEESGGNPFYLEELARSVVRADGSRRSTMTLQTDLGVPAGVAAALDEEVGLLSEAARAVFEGAAVAGDPFDVELAADTAATTEQVAMNAVDELLWLDLIRTTEVPRRFRFRHPLVRRAAYERTSAAWRVAAHERCASALEARGASAIARAHHMERSARRGDRAAVAVLAEAGESSAALAPESAAQWFGAALRLLPDDAPAQDRISMLLARTRALAAAGRFEESHAAVLEAVALAARQERAQFVAVATACASVERLVGQYEHAHGRLIGALRVLPEGAAVDRVELLMELTLNEFYRSRYEAMAGWAASSLAAATVVGDPALAAAAAVMVAFGQAMTGPTAVARLRRDEAAALVDDLSDDELSARSHTAGWLAIAEVYLDLYAEADAHATRALALARATGEGDPLHRLYPVLPRIWYVRSKLAEAAELLDDAIEAGRLLGSPPSLAGNLFNRSAVALASGDMSIALATAEESVELTRDLDDGFVTAWAAVRLAAVLVQVGQAERALELLAGRAGGEELALIPGGWRAFCLELLTRCHLALDNVGEAQQAAARAATVAASVGLPLPAAWADRAGAAVALASGDVDSAIQRALLSVEGALEAGAPIEAALSGTLAGRALAQAGDRERAVAELQRAARTFDGCGAIRFREQTELELGKLGLRPHRRSRPGNGGVGIEALTERERQVTNLVVDRRTNAEIAAELFLSQKTIETHLRNIFNKVGVDSRAALARVAERAE